MQTYKFSLILAFTFATTVLLEATSPQQEEFLFALSRGNAEKVSSLLKEQPSLVSLCWTEAVLGETSNTAATPLHVAAYSGQKAIVELLLKAKANVNAKDSGGCTPLHYAMKKNGKDVIPLLLAAGANVNARNRDGYTPLHACTLDTRLDSMQLLLVHSADVNARTKEGATPLHFAAAGDQTAATELLVAKGADVHAKTDEGATPLAMALFQGCQHTPDILRRLGATK